MTDTYLKPAKIGAMELRNRIIMGSMHTGLEEHKTLDDLAAFYKERAEGEVGLIITGGIGPNPEGAVFAGGAVMMNSGDAAKHKVVTDTVHKAGGKIAMQILHSGRYAINPKCVAPSAIKAPINPFPPKSLENKEVYQAIDDFANCAVFAKEAGYDGVEIMGSEGYLINQFLVTHTNQRDDEFGGSYENRMRFAIEIVRKTRAAVGKDFGIIFRISLLDLIENGSTWDEISQLAKALESEGVDAFNSGFGWHEARIPTIAASVPPTPFLDFTARLKSQTHLPVIAANRFFEPAQIEKAIDDGQADFVAMARPFLADAHFVKKAKDAALIMPCIACNQACLDRIFAMKPASCLVNPRAGREIKMPVILSDSPKNIAVVGAGPAGMSAALVLTERGHKTTLFEQSGEIGGQLKYAAKIPGKEDFKRLLGYYAGAIEQSQIPVRFELATLENLKGFDEIVIATGVLPRVPEIAGVGGENVRSYDDLIINGSTADKITLIGSGPIGFDVASFLLEEEGIDPDKWRSEWGVGDPSQTAGGLTSTNHGEPKRDITMLQRSTTRFGKALGKTTGWIHKARLDHAGVKMIGGVVYHSIENGEASITIDDAAHTISSDEIILCAGQESQRELFDELEANGISAHMIGGAKDARKIDAERAILEAYQLALSL